MALLIPSFWGHQNRCGMGGSRCPRISPLCVFVSCRGVAVSPCRQTTGVILWRLSLWTGSSEISSTTDDQQQWFKTIHLDCLWLGRDTEVSRLQFHRVDTLYLSPHGAFQNAFFACDCGVFLLPMSTGATNPPRSRYAVIWTGDNTGSWEYIRMQIPTVIGSGLSGFAHATGDVTQASIWIFLKTLEVPAHFCKTWKWRVFVGYQLSNNYHMQYT